MKKNNNKKAKSGSFLMFKQGIKGVLKFKIQFIVIILLSFLASLLLSVASTSSERLHNNFVNSVSDSDKFDYLYTMKVGKADNKQKQNGMPLMSDFISDQYIANYEIADGHYIPRNSIFNINVSSFDGFSGDKTFAEKEIVSNRYNETFVTKALESKEFSDIFGTFIDSDAFRNNVIRFNYDPNQDEYNYNPHWLDNAAQAPSWDFDKQNDFYNGFIDSSITLLRTELVKELTLKKEQNSLDNTLIQRLVKTNKINISDISKTSYQDSKRIFQENELFINSYIENAFWTLMTQMIFNLEDYFATYVNAAMGALGETFEPEDFVKKFNGNEIKIKDIGLKGDEGISDYSGFKLINDSINEPSNNLKDILYAYTFGKEINNSGASNSSIVKRFLVDSSTKEVPWTNIILTNDENAKIANSNIDLKSKGLRGSLTQWTYLSENENENLLNEDILAIKPSQLPKFLYKIDRNEEFVTSLGKIDQLNGIDDFSFGSSTPLNKLFFLRNKIIATAVDLSYRPRAEMFTMDNTNETKYRTIILTDNIAKRVNVFKGRMPSNKSEILINPEYAYAKNLKVGDYISVGGGSFLISGFASDPLSFFPSSDIDNPIPNNKKGAIVYAKPNVADRINDDSFHQYTSSTFSILLNDLPNGNNSSLTLSSKINLFYAYNNLAYTEVGTNNTFIQQTDEQINETKDFEINAVGSLSAFDASNLKLNFILFPTILKSYEYSSMIISFILMIIVIISMIIAIRKTIKLNSNQIGILKAMGTKSSMISFSYISYSVIIMVFVIPLTWLASGFIHEFVSGIFLSYFGGARWEFMLSWKTLLIQEFAMGLVTLLVSYFSAYLITSQSTLKIMENKEKIKRSRFIDFLKLKIFKKSKFTTRFSLELASVGFSKTFTLATIMFCAGFLIFGTIAIPGVVYNFVNSYYKSVEYSNEINYLKPIGNAPLGRSQLSASYGIDYYDNQVVESNNFFGDSVDLVTKDLNNISGINDSSVVPKFIYKGVDSNGNPKYDWFFESMSKIFDSDDNTFDDDSETNEGLLSFLSQIFGSNFTFANSRSFQISEVLLLEEYLIHNTKYSHTGNKQEDDKRMNELRLKLDKILAVFNKGIPNILSQIIGGLPEGDSWKDRVISAILGSAPNYLKEFIYKTKSRSSQFAFGYEFANYNIGKDIPYSKIDVVSKNGKESTLIGMPNFQNAILTNNENWKISDKTSDQIADLFKGIAPNSDIVDEKSKIKIFNKSTGELIIPAALNKQAELIYPKIDSSFGDINALTTRININGIDIPREAWMYDDIDYLSILNKDDSYSTLKDNENRWLNVDDLNKAKIGLLPQYIYENPDYDVMKLGIDKNKVQELSPSAYSFAEYYYDEDGNLKSRIRPYYEYDNIDLFIPKSITSGIEKITAANSNQLRANSWIDKNVSNSDVPDIVKKSWAKRKSSYKDENYVAIKPYTMKYSRNFITPTYTKGVGWEGSFGLNPIILGYNSFIEDAFINPDKVITYSNVNYDSKIESNNIIKKIKLSQVSKIGSYGDSVVVVNQDLANLINGYSNSKYIPYNYQITPEKNNGYIDMDGVKINSYDLIRPEDLTKRDINDQIYGRNDYEKNLRYNNWYTGMYSMTEEPSLITTQASFTRSVRVGNSKVYMNSYNPFNSTLEAEGIQFLSQSKGLIVQISTLVTSIAIIIIVIFVLVSILLIVIVSDLYVNQYKKFMIIMKSLGYRNWKIIKYVMGTVTILSTITMLIGAGLSFGVVKIIVDVLENHGKAIPFGLTWWSPIVSLLLIVGAYVSSIAISTRKIRKESPVSLF